MKKLFIFNTAIMSLTSVFLRMLMVRYNVYLADKLTAEGMGLFSLIMTIYSFAVTVATSGISLATTRIVSEEASLNNDKGIKIAVFRCVLLALLLSCFSFGVIYCFDDFISEHIFQQRLSRDFVKLLALCFPSISVSSVFNGYFTAVRRVGKNSFVQILEEIVKITITVLLIEYFEPATIEACCTYIIFGNIAGEYISMVLAMFIYIRSAYGFKNEKSSNNITKRILKITIPVALSSYLKSALSSIKQILIPRTTEKAGYSSKEALSSYGEIGGMAVPVIMFPTSISSSLSVLVIPEIARCYTTKQFERIKNIIAKTYSAIIEFSICSALVFTLFGYKLGIMLYNNANVGIYITLMAPLVIIMYADTLTDSILKGIDCQNSVVIINIIDAVICIFLISVIIPLTGAAGYILILYISETINIILSLSALVKKIKFRINLCNIITSLLSAAVTAYTVTYLKGNIAMLITETICIYYIVCYLIKIFDLKFSKIMLK